ncbi:MAG: type II toxin-antitoxin system RelE/ParE family toxin [Caldilineaceae bacterium]
MDDELILRVVFFRSPSGREFVRDWLKDLEKDDRKAIGEDIKLVQLRWPLGLPLVRKMEANLWEVRSNLSGGRIARVFFTVRNGEMALLHGFMKKSQKTPAKDLETAQRRRDLWLNEQSI